MNLREAAQQALDAMDDLHRTGDTQVFDMYGREATEALRAALEPVTDCHEKEGDKLAPPLDHIPDADKMVTSVRESRTVEPVAYIHETGFLVRNPAATLTAGMKLYSAPPKRKPLTDEEIQKCVGEVDDARLSGPITKLIRAVERAHGIGGEE